MSALTNIFKKELKELLTPAAILPIVVLAILFGSIGSSMEGIQSGLEEKPIIGVINEDSGNFSKLANSIINNHSRVIYNSTDSADKQQALEQITAEQGLALLIIPQNFSKNIYNNTQGQIDIYWIMRGAGIFDTISSETVQAIISIINREISRYLIDQNTTINASIVLSPTVKTDTTYFKDRVIHLPPTTISGMLSSQSLLIPIVIMMIIIMAGSMVISSMALEKENKTLETLLTLPIKRTSIVTGKIAASALIGLLFAVVYMIGMSRYFQGMQFSDSINLADFNLALTSSDFLLIGISLFITLIAALSLCMLLGTMAKNYKSAQTLTFPITMLAMIPMFITMFTDFDTLPLALKTVIYAIPFSHPMIAPKALIFNDYSLVISGIIYVSLFALVTIFIVVWLFKTDRILTGSTKKNWKNIFTKRTKEE
ncbi:MAG: ABC transporter permease [Thermoplasmatota archaeon]